MTNAISDVREFNKLMGADFSEFNVRSVALYKGLQIEELVEGLEEIFKGGRINADKLLEALRDLSLDFKRGYFDREVSLANRTTLLDSDIDSIYVSIGAALASGADVEGAWKEVQASNMSKLNPLTGLMDKDDNGKGVKGSAYFPPQLSHFTNEGIL